MSDLVDIPGVDFDFDEDDEDDEGSRPPSFSENLNNILQCPDCRKMPPNLVEEFSSGDMVCGDCGVVIGDRMIDTRSEWRTFANDEGGDDPSRVGQAADELLEGDQLETRITFDKNGGAAAQALSKAHKRTLKDKGTIALLAGYASIATYCESLNAGKAVADTAKHILKLVDENKVIRGKRQEAVVAGCIFVACRQLNAGRTFQEINNLTQVPKKEVGRVFKQLENFLKKHTDKMQQKTGQAVGAGSSYTKAGSTGADELCVRFCSNLGFRNPVQIEKVARFLVGKASLVKGLSGRSPLSLASACIYAASHLMGDAKTHRDVANVASISEGTIKTAYKIMFRQRSQVIDVNWLRQNKARLDKLPKN